MPTATLVADNVAGHSAPARVWHLDPPLPGVGAYVCTWISPGTRYQAAEVLAVPCNERGNVLGTSVRRGGGSFVLHESYDGTPDYQDGAHWLALQLLGGYAVEEA